MNDHILNQILEESLGTIIQNVRPVIEESIQNTPMFTNTEDQSSNNHILDILREIHLNQTSSHNSTQTNSEDISGSESLADISPIEDLGNIQTETTNVFTSTIPTTIRKVIT